MAETLHRAIRDALRDASYASRDITVATFLDATRPLDADETLLYRCVYTIFRALPARLLRGSTLNISTCDIEDGIELVWEGREAVTADGNVNDARAALARGPHGDLLDIAFGALEHFCHVRAGHVESTRGRVVSGSSFDRPPYVVRRVLAHIPALTPPSRVDAAVPSRPPTNEQESPGAPGRAPFGFEAARRPYLLA